MIENRASSSASTRSWLDRLSQALLGEPQDKEQLLELLRDAEQRELLDADALSMIEGVMQVSDMQVRDIMIPRAQMVVVEQDASPESFITPVIESGHSRFPVIGDNRDEVVGILLAKDLLDYFALRKDGEFQMRDVMRPPVFIPESKRLNVLLREFRASRNHMAIVVDEYGGVSGLVTIEDVLEQIVGEIDDEHDVDEGQDIKPHGRGEYIVKALTPIEDFNEYFDTRYSDQEFDTIGGLVVKAFGYVPKRGEARSLDNVHFTILRADKRRVHLLRVFVPKMASEGRMSATPTYTEGHR
jgi:magnesium and cobalt transporter